MRARIGGMPLSQVLPALLALAADPRTDGHAEVRVPEGFRLEEVARELRQPSALALDARGRVWLAQAAPAGAELDASEVLVLVDDDHDGAFETRVVFARGLARASGLELGLGGVWVAAGRALVFLPDRDDDLVPDGPPEVRLDGFGRQDERAAPHSLAFGPDGWLYGCQGEPCQGRVGAPGTPDELRTPIGAGVWRYHPERREVELFARGPRRPTGLAFDAGGQAFVSAHDDAHLFHAPPGGRCAGESGGGALATIADHRHELAAGAPPGAAGRGALVYEADAFPPEWRGRILFADASGARVLADELVPSGSGFVARQAPELLEAPGARFVGFALAPEGGVYLLDSGAARADGLGRLWRLSYGPHRALKVDLAALPNGELVRLLFHSNAWFARHAQGLLHGRDPDGEVQAALRRVALEKGDGRRELRALWALHVAGGIDPRLGLELLDSSDELVRAWTVRCLLERRPASSELCNALALRAMREPSPVVRLALAAGLQRLPLAQRFGLARALVAHGEDAQDPNLPLLLRFGLEDLAVAEPEHARVLAHETRIETLAAFLGGAAQTPDPATLAIENVAVLPMEREVVLADQTVLVRDGRIVALGPAGALAVPADARRIDGRGRYLMPGLADMHVHVWDENDLYLFVANGVTTVRNMFGAPLHLDWRARIERGELVGPRLYTAGPIIDGAPAVWPGSTELVDPDEAAGVVAAQKAAGYDFLKPYARLTRECYEALVIAGEEQGLALMGHVPEALTLADVLEAHQHTIEHMGGWAEAAQRPDSPYRSVDFATEALAWQEVDAERLAGVAAAVRAAGSWNCPTLVVLQKWQQGDEARALLARPEMRYVSPFLRAAWEPGSPSNYLARLPAATTAAARRSVPAMQRAVRALRDAGGGILLGTDMGNPCVVAGFAVHEELVNLVAAGLTPFEALRAGTADAARCMGAEEDWGTLVPGRRADLILLEANPLEDVRNAARRVGVVLHGRWFPAEELAAELERRAQAFESR